MNSPRPMIPPVEVEHFRLRAAADLYVLLAAVWTSFALAMGLLAFFIAGLWVFAALEVVAAAICMWRLRAIYRRLQELEVFIP